MRFKTIFLIFALAMFMLSGVVWAEDDDQGEEDDPLDPTCPYKVVIDADLVDWSLIYAAFDYECAQVNIHTQVRARLLSNEEDDDSGDPSWLTDVEDIFEETIPATVTVCAVCDPITIQYLSATSCANLNEAIAHTSIFVPGDYELSYRDKAYIGDGAYYIDRGV
jgi:hypothetical protein